MRREFRILALTAGLGTVLHFLYTWLPIPLVGVFAPVGESPWEHLKLLYWPWLAACFLCREEGLSYWAGVCLGLLGMPPFLLGVYATARWGLLIQSVGFDICLYYLTVCLGVWILHRAKFRGLSPRQTGIFIMLSGLWGGTLLILSAAPLELPLFQ